MLFNIVIFLLLLILKVYSNAQNHISEQLASLILSVADNNGNLLTNNIFDNNGDLIEFQFNNNNINNNNLLIIGREGNNDLTIIDVIPTLSINYIMELLNYENKELSEDNIRERINSEFKELYNLSLEVFRGKYLDNYLTVEKNNRKFSELGNAESFFDYKCFLNKEILKSLENNIKQFLDDNENNEVLNTYLGDSLTDTTKLYEKLNELLSLSFNNNNEYKKEIYDIDNSIFENIKNKLLTSKKNQLKTLAKKINNELSNLSNNDITDQDRERYYNNIYKLINSSLNNNKIKAELLSVVEEQIPNYNTYFYNKNKNTYNLENAKSNSDENTNLLNLQTSLLNSKIDKQLNLYNIIKSENDKVKNYININTNDLTDENYDILVSTIKETESQLASAIERDIILGKISKEKIETFYNIKDENLINNLEIKFNQGTINIDDINKINDDINNIRTNDRNNLLKYNNIVENIIESNSIFCKIYRDKPSNDNSNNNNNNSNDYNNLIKGNYRLITDNKRNLQYTGYTNNSDGIKFSSFYNTIKFFIGEYKNSASFPNSINSNNQINTLFINHSSSISSNDLSRITNYLLNNEQDNDIDINYINLMLKIAKDFAGSSSLDINNFKSLDIIQSASGQYHIVGITNSNKVGEILRFKNDSHNPNGFVSISLTENTKYVDYDKVIDNSYNKNTDTTGNRVQPGIALLAKTGSTLIRTDNNGNVLDTYLPEDYVIDASNNDNGINFYQYDIASNSIKGKKFINKNKVKREIIGTGMLTQSAQITSSNPSAASMLKVKCNYYSNAFPSIGKYISEAYNTRQTALTNLMQNNIENDNLDNSIIENAMRLTQIEYIQPINHNGNFEGYINDKGHSREYKNMFQFNTNLQNKLSCTNTYNPVRKRSTDSCSNGGISISMYEDANNNIRDILSILSKVSEEASELYSDINEQIISGDINYDIENTLNKIINIYENNINDLNIADKKNILSIIQDNINLYINELSTNESFNKENFISKDFIEKLKLKLNHHYSKLEMEMINNNNNISNDNEIFKADYSKNANSIYYKEMLMESINDLYSIINYNNDDINIGLLYNINNNDELVDNERNYDIDYLCNEIETMEIDEDKKEEFRNKLLKIYKNINEINNINQVDQYFAGVVNNNFEIVNMLSITLSDKLKEEFPDDENIQNLNPIDSYSLESSNIINLEHIKKLYGDNHIDYITSDISSKYYIKYFMDNLKFKILLTEDETLDKDVFDEIKSLETKINDKIKQIKQYDSANGHFEEIDHFVQLLNEYNDLVSVAIANNKISTYKYDTNTINLIELDEETSNRINYIRTQKLLNGVNKIIESNPELFEMNISEKLEDYINTSGSNTIRYTWGNKEIFEPTVADYNKILKSSVETKADAISFVINEISDNTDLMDIKDSYKIKANQLKSHSPMSLNSDEVDEVYAVTEKVDGISNNWSNIESYQEYSSRTFMKFLKAAAKYDDYIDIDNIKNNKDGTIDISSIYKDGSTTTFYELFSTMSEFIDLMDENNLLSDNDKENINKAMKELKKHVEGCKYNLSKSVGRENSSSFNQVLSEFSSISSASEILFKSNLKVNQNHPDKVSFNFSSSSNTENLHNINKKFSNQTKNKRQVEARIKKLLKQRKRKMV